MHPPGASRSSAFALWTARFLFDGGPPVLPQQDRARSPFPAERALRPELLLVRTAVQNHTHAGPTPVAPDFRSLGVPEAIARVLDDRGLETAFPIQAATLPTTLA